MNPPSLVCAKCGKTHDLTRTVDCDLVLHPEQLTAEMEFRSCPVCGAVQVYRQKDFNRPLGFLIILVGAVAVPWTYGLSMVVVATIDWLLYRRVPDSIVCYQCRSEYRHFPKIPDHIQSFDHHTAELYENTG